MEKRSQQRCAWKMRRKGSQEKEKDAREGEGKRKSACVHRRTLDS